MKPGVLIVGAGGFGRAVADAIALGSSHRVAGFVDDRAPALEAALGHPVLGRVENLPALRRDCGLLVVAIGHNERRREICQQARAVGFELATVVHPRAFVSGHAKLGAGAMVMAAAVIGTEAEVGEGAIVNAGAVVDHHARVGEFAHLGVGACMGGGALLAPLAWLREGAVLGAGQQLLLTSGGSAA